MNRQRNQQFGAALYGPVQYRPTAVPLHTEQHNAVVQGLRDALLSAINQIKSLQENNKSLEEKINLQENQWRQVESRLQEELRQKHELLKRSLKKRQARTQAYMDVLALLAQKERELEMREEEWKARCGAQEESLQELAEEEEEETKVKNEEKSKMAKVYQVAMEEVRMDLMVVQKCTIIILCRLSFRRDQTHLNLHPAVCP
ncbi:trichohyalin-like [Seriola aureovittata]|uniref:trichohyalin-like n=1 Tax=Seriola aureovittata TaxID=2871759 RepID=UPI0024BE673E|nr:trichohyalin-like [Seriola aureovittata]